MTFPVQGQEYAVSNNVLRLGINPQPVLPAKWPWHPPESNEEIEWVRLFQGSKLSCGRGRNFCCFGYWPKPGINPLL